MRFRGAVDSKTLFCLTPGTMLDTSMAASSLESNLRQAGNKNVPFYYGYYSSKWGKLGDGKLKVTFRHSRYTQLDKGQ